MIRNKKKVMQSLSCEGATKSQPSSQDACSENGDIGHVVRVAFGPSDVKGH